MEAERIEDHFDEDYPHLAKDHLEDSIFQYHPNSLIFISNRGAILKYNKAFRNLHLKGGVSLEKLNLLDFFGDTSREFFKEMLGWLDKKEGEIQKELILVNTVSEKLVFNCSLKSVKNGTQRLGLVSLEQKGQISKEDEQENKYSQLFMAISDNITEGIFRNSKEDGLIYVNNSFSKLFGYKSAKEVLTNTQESFYANIEDRERLVAILEDVGKFNNETVQFRRKDGTTFWGLVNSSITREFNGRTYYDGAIVDITEQKNSENQLKQKNRELIKLNAQMDRFFYCAYHDMRSPIASAMGLTNIMRMELQDEDMKVYLNKIDESLSKLDYFISDIKFFSLNARQKLVSNKINFHTLIYDVWKKFKSVHDLINLQVKVDDDKFFYSDSARISLILQNVLKNCVQFIDKTKNDHYIKVTFRLTFDKVNIELIDNGIGISKQHLDKVFNMFYRGTEVSKGAGLGLYIVKETILKLKGRINIESELGLGTILNIEIPNDSKGRLMSRKFMLQRP